MILWYYLLTSLPGNISFYRQHEVQIYAKKFTCSGCVPIGRIASKSVEETKYKWGNIMCLVSKYPPRDFSQRGSLKENRNFNGITFKLPKTKNSLPVKEEIRRNSETEQCSLLLILSANNGSSCKKQLESGKLYIFWKQLFSLLQTKKSIRMECYQRSLWDSTFDYMETPLQLFQRVQT